jgi:hypothetical protein
LKQFASVVRLPASSLRQFASVVMFQNLAREAIRLSVEPFRRIAQAARLIHQAICFSRGALCLTHDAAGLTGPSYSSAKWALGDLRYAP